MRALTVRLERRAIGIRMLAILLLALVGLVYPDRNLSLRPAFAATSVTAPAAPTLALSTSGQEPGDFVLAGFGSSATLLVSVGFVSPPAGTTFSLPTTTGLTAAYGYNFVGGKTQISWTGTMANSNTALAAMTVATGATNGTITIRVTASVSRANTYYNPINDHYYEYISTTASTQCASGSGATCVTNIESAIQSKTLHGDAGYWVTITDSQENSFIASNMNAPNIAIGLSDRATEGTWKWLGGPEAGQTATYTSWSAGEPNDWGSGEDYVVTNWSGGAGSWNDYGMPETSGGLAYVVEYDGPYSGDDTATASVSAIVDNAPRNVSASRASPAVSGSLDVSWTAPSTGTVTTYTVTSSPGSLTCTSATTSCTVTGLTNGTSYTFTVTATFNDSTTKTSTASASAIPDDGASPSVSSFTSSDTTPSRSTSFSYTLTMSESITGLAAGDFENTGTATGCSFSPSAATGTSLTITVASCSSGTIIPRLKAAQVADAVGNIGPASATAATTTITRDATAPTVTLAASAATSSTATITFTITGDEALDCTTLSVTDGTDFTLTGISAISSIAQTSSTICTVTATSTASAGGAAVTSTLTAAGSFSMTDAVGNAQTTLTASPQSTSVTVPAAGPAAPESEASRDDRCAKANHAFDDCPLWPGRTTTTTSPPATTSTTTTTTTTTTSSLPLQPLLPVVTTTVPATTSSVRRSTTTTT
ncbi:MAG: hypothetical protein RL283_1110, partial [Actinomycetota bacterium]